MYLHCNYAQCLIWAGAVRSAILALLIFGELVPGSSIKLSSLLQTQTHTQKKKNVEQSRMH